MADELKAFKQDEKVMQENEKLMVRGMLRFRVKVGVNVRVRVRLVFPDRTACCHA